jgi:hypothetical protein
MLREMQQAFLNGVFAGDKACALDHIVDDGQIGAARRFSIYHDNAFISLGKTLAVHFPVIERLVGEAFFRYAAHEYIRAHPPRVPQLLAYGDGFAEFIGAFEPARSVPYLGDVARLEWARNEALFAADAPPINADALRAYPADRYGDLKFELHPTVRWVGSPWPIQTIWQANQEETVPRVDVHAGGETALVLRPGHKVINVAITAGDAAMMEALKAGRTLEEAADVGTGIDTGFDLQAALVGHLKRGTFISATL